MIKLSLATFYHEVTTDILDWNECGNDYITVPVNCFNIRQLYAFNSNCPGDKCSCKCNNQNIPECWSFFREIHLKRGYDGFGGTGIKTAKITNRYDSINRVQVYPYVDLLWYNTQNEKIISSEGTRHFKNIRIVYNGFPSNNDTLPVIPRVA